jgi:hypothetical protein
VKRLVNINMPSRERACVLLLLLRLLLLPAATLTFQIVVAEEQFPQMDEFSYRGRDVA